MESGYSNTESHASGHIASPAERNKSVANRPRRDIRQPSHLKDYEINNVNYF